MPVPFKLFCGFRIPLGADEGHFRAASRRTPSPGEIGICSYVKSGTTWVQHIVYLLLRRGVPAHNLAQVIEAIPFPEQDGMPTGKHPIAWKYHLPFRLTPFSKDARYLYVARNPKDACVSYYHFLKKLPGYDIKGFDDFFEAFLTGELPYGNSMEHVLEWSEGAAHLPNVLFLTYEDLSRDREGTVKSVARFLGLGELDDTTLRNVQEYSSFEFMRGLESRDDSMLKYLTASTGTRREDGSCQPQMMRRGVVGDWRNYFTSEQSRRMDEYMNRKAKGTLWELAWADDMTWRDVCD